MILAGSTAVAQQFNVLHSFASTPVDGEAPTGDLIFDPAGNIYGVTEEGGTAGYGTVYELSPNSGGGWTETVLYNFCSVNNNCPDGLFPMAGLIRDAHGNLFGTTYGGGSPTCPYWRPGCGTVYELSPPSAPGGAWTETILYNFCTIQSANNCVDGGFPRSQLVADSLGNLYGTASFGGVAEDAGLVFELSRGKNGWTETVLYNFCSVQQVQQCPNGAIPVSAVVRDKSGNLYGTTQSGGVLQGDDYGGVVYELSPSVSGWTETVLYAFAPPYAYGTDPYAPLVLDDAGSLYGTAVNGGEGGIAGPGSVFKLNPNNTSSDRVFTFNGSDGANPTARVLLDAKLHTLYSTTQFGGSGNVGVAFQMVTPEQEQVLYNFCSLPNCTDGSYPSSGLVEDKLGNLYGTTSNGGQSDRGVLYEITP